MRGERTRINPAVVDTKSYEVDLLALDLSSIDSRVLLLKVVRKLRTIVSTIRLGEETKVTVLVLRELSVEGLKKVPDPRGSCKSGYSVVGAVAEAGGNRLINIQL